MRMDNAISTLVGEELLGWCDKWEGSVPGINGSIYGIPNEADQVVKFNPVDKSITHIGPHFGDRCKWKRGAITASGVIYCSPEGDHRGILKIDTNTDNVTELNRNLLPERAGCMWLSGAAAPDGRIYFMPYMAHHIMKLDPNNNDAISSVGDDLGVQDLGHEWLYIGTVVGIDGCVYGIPSGTKRIVKYDPINDITSYVGEEADKVFRCGGNGVLGRDGCIYAFATRDGRVLKIDTTNNSHCFVGNTIQLDHDLIDPWGDAILGIDGCIYWPPVEATHIMKYDPHSNLTSLVGDDFIRTRDEFKWSGGCAAQDGIIYCLPCNANRILAIDPLKEYVLSLKNNMEQFPEKLGCIFQPSDDIPDETNFDRAVTKFGLNKVLEVLDECMPLVDQACAMSNLYPFMIAASYKSSNLSAIYHVVVRQVPSLVSASTIVAAGNTAQNDKKRKQDTIY